MGPLPQYLNTYRMSCSLITVASFLKIKMHSIGMKLCNMLDWQRDLFYNILIYDIELAPGFSQLAPCLPPLLAELMNSSDTECGIHSK